MEEIDIDKIIQFYDSFIQVIRQLSMSTEEQIQKLRGYVVADEIASDFSEIGMAYARELLNNGWITQEQFNIAQDIDKKVEGMSQKKELWNDAALLNSMEWDTCRKYAIELLKTLE